MYDNIHTKYKDAKIFINEINAEAVLEDLTKDLQRKNMTAEKYAYLSKAYIFAGKDELALKYAKLAVKTDKSYLFSSLPNYNKYLYTCQTSFLM